MQITLHNFGGFVYKSTGLETMTLPHGHGKTTLLNAYYFALCGRTLPGFEARKVGTPKVELTEVILCGGVWPYIRRTKSETGETALYIGSEYCTQSLFVQAMQGKGIDVGFACACVNTNVLTDPSLTADDLRKLLAIVDAIDGDEVKALKDERTKLNKSKAQAEQFALSNVSIPARTVEQPSDTEITFMHEYAAAKRIVDAGLKPHCVACGQTLPKDLAKELRDKFERADLLLMREDEYNRIYAQTIAYGTESVAIQDAQRLIDNARKAREDVKRYDQRLKELDELIKQADEAAVNAELPEGVTVITEKKAKNGSVSATCVLEYHGVPLKSVNRAKRIEICVRLLGNARSKKGMQDVPIIIDNAESCQTGTEDIENVIYLYAGQGTYTKNGTWGSGYSTPQSIKRE